MRWIGPWCNIVIRVPPLPTGRNPHGLLVNLPASTRSPLFQLFSRILIALGLLTVMVLIVVVDRDGYRDSYDGKVGLIDSIYYATVTLTTTGYGDLVPAGNPGRTLAVLEALLGQLFLVTAVAKVVNVWSPRGWRDKVHPQGMAQSEPDTTSVNTKPPATEE